MKTIKDSKGNELLPHFFVTLLGFEKVWMTGSVLNMDTPQESHHVFINIIHDGNRAKIELSLTDFDKAVFSSEKEWHLDEVIKEKIAKQWTSHSKGQVFKGPTFN